MRKEPLLPNHYYHLYNRGVNYADIFFEDENWVFFLRRLRYYFTQKKADIVAYCLMPNHYHLLVQVKIEQFGDKVMQPFSVSYTKAINRRYKRVGSLFQGPFQYKHVAADSYLLALSRYIHRNPVAAGLVGTPEAWAFSSYREYVGLRHGTLPRFDIVKTLLLGERSGPAKTFGAAYAAYVNEATVDVPEELLFD